MDHDNKYLLISCLVIGSILALGLIPVLSGFATAQSYCGDGQKSYGEECDLNDFSGWSCNSFGFDSGQLSCTQRCKLNASMCTSTAPSETKQITIPINNCVGETCEKYIEDSQLLSKIRLTSCQPAGGEIKLNYLIKPTSYYTQQIAAGKNESVAAGVMLESNCQNPNVSAEIQMKLPCIAVYTERIEKNSMQVAVIENDGAIKLNNFTITNNNCGKEGEQFISGTVQITGLTTFIVFGKVIPQLVVDFRPLELLVVILAIILIIAILLVKDLLKVEKTFEETGKEYGKQKYAKVSIKVKNTSKHFKRVAEEIVIEDSIKNMSVVNIGIRDNTSNKVYELKEIALDSENVLDERVAKVKTPTAFRLKDKLIFVLRGGDLMPQEEVDITYIARYTQEPKMKKPKIRYSERILVKE